MTLRAVNVTPQQAEELKAAQQRASRRSDALFVSGALLTSIGLGWIRLPWGMIAAGVFLLFMPMLEVLGSFLKGLRASRH